MDRAKGFVTQKLGPLPFWAWLLLVVAAIVIVMTVLKNRGGQAAGLPGLSSLGGSNLPDGLSPNSSGSGSDNLPANPQTTPVQQFTANPPPTSVFGAANSNAGNPTNDVNQLRWQPPQLGVGSVRAARDIPSGFAGGTQTFQQSIAPGWSGGTSFAAFNPISSRSSGTQAV